MGEDDGFMSDFDFPSDSEIGAFAQSKPACPHPQNSNRTSHYTKWTSEEDDLLKEAADQLKFDWTMVAKHFPGKTSACVRKRWDLKHNPSTIKSKWTVEEDELILKLMRELGGGFWKSISKQMPGRPPDVIKNRYYSVLRRRIYKSDPLQPSQNGQPAQNYREPELTPETQLADDCVFDFLSLGTDPVSLQPALALCSREEKLKKVAMLESTLEVLHDLLRRTKSEISDLAQELNENEGIMEALPS